MQPLHLRLRHALSLHAAYGTDWTDDVARTVACSMVICRLDYCNAFLGRKKTTSTFDELRICFLRLKFRHFTANDAMQMFYCCWYRPHSMRSRVYETVPCPSVCPAVCLSQHQSTAAKLSLQVCCCGLGGQDISTDCCSRGGRRANAGSATLSAYVCS